MFRMGTSSLSEEEVEHIAWLARIKLSKVEKEHFTRQFNTIINYFHVIDEADTESIKPIFHIVDLTNISRDDVVENSLQSNEALANALRRKRGYFKAPKMV